MIDLHLVSWNRSPMTKLVIETIYRNTKPENFMLYVFDNGSEAKTRQMLQAYYSNGKINRLDLQDDNKGLEFARQSLLSYADPNSYFICIDNDCLPPPIDNNQDWIDRLVDLMERYEDYAAVSCRTQVMIGTGNIFEDESKDITDFPHPGGSLRIMRTSVVREVGGWDRAAPGRGSEERYIGGKLQAAGYKTGFATHIPTLHLFGTRAEGRETDRWGYDKQLPPEATGHSDIWHPALANGDDPVEVEKYAGKELTEGYFNAHGDSQKK